MAAIVKDSVTDFAGASQDWGTTSPDWGTTSPDWGTTSPDWGTTSPEWGTTTEMPPVDWRQWFVDVILQRANNGAGGGFLQAFIASISVVIVSELGDKTFFIAAIMAMKHPRMLVFGGAILALVFMTALSAGFGSIATVIPRMYTYYASAALFAIFGIKMLRDGIKMDPSEGQDELEDVQAELKRLEDQSEKEQSVELMEGGGGGAGAGATTRRRRAVWRVVSQAATLTFLAEWGDRSQLATVVLATRENPFGVVVGGSMGHALCTGLAVIGGRMIAQRISARTVTIAGGAVFLLFALSAVFIGPGE